ncbi:MAG: DUF4190 domain-containing protein [Verrucomicrobiia bacterium]|jgi:hypothetical protein
MYKIIGADGKEYGPVSAEQLRQWIADGRANAETLAQLVGSAEWKPLGRFPEFDQFFVHPPSAVIPPAHPPAPAALRPRVNGHAVAGFIMGILGCTPFGWICCIPLFSVLGIIYSSNGLSQINRNPTQETGRGFAVAGLVFSIVGLVAPLAISALFSTMGMWGRHPFFWHRHWHF